VRCQLADTLTVTHLPPRIIALDEGTRERDDFEVKT